MLKISKKHDANLSLKFKRLCIDVDEDDVLLVKKDESCVKPSQRSVPCDAKPCPKLTACDDTCDDTSFKNSNFGTKSNVLVEDRNGMWLCGGVSDPVDGCMPARADVTVLDHSLDDSVPGLRPDGKSKAGSESCSVCPGSE